MIEIGQPLPSPRELFDLHVPEHVQRMIVELVIEDYSRAQMACEELFHGPERHDLIGDVRRGFIEQDLREAMKRLGFGATAVMNRRKTSYHTRVVAGPVIITQSCVDSLNAMVRDAAFRLAYSDKPQLYLFEEMADDEELALGQAPFGLYAILVHAPHPKFADQPGFIRVVFPARGGDAYQDAPIDILGRFPDLAGQLRRLDVDQIPPSSAEPYEGPENNEDDVGDDTE